ncbi:MAG TPA: response regulator transcription factor [Armatimonadota bacterium]|nr:response regulator transcription factor [Armatimonadota bacterium]
MRILIIEDERQLNRTLCRGLSQEGYLVDQAFDGEEGLALAKLNRYDLVILDVALPHRDGCALCHEMRREGLQTPVLMLTARDSVDDRVRGLDSGADDYLVKPFAFRELLARTRALLRRDANERSPVLRVADLSLDTRTHEVRRGAELVSLSSKEFAVLEYFMHNPGRVLTRQMIAEHAWDYSFDPNSNVIDVYIRYLRLKIDAGYEPKLLQTVRGFGYKLTAGG